LSEARVTLILKRIFDALIVLLYRENLALKAEVDQASMFEEIVGSSASFRAVLFHNVYSCGAGSWHSGSHDCGSQNDEGRRDKRKPARLMDLSHVFGDYTWKDYANQQTRVYSDRGDGCTLSQNDGENVARWRPECHPDSELTCAPADREGKNARHSHYRDEQCHGCESAKHDCIEAVGREDFRADVCA